MDAFLKSYDHGALVNQDRRAGVDEVEKELLERSWGQEQPTRLRSSRCVVARAAADGLRGHSTFLSTDTAIVPSVVAVRSVVRWSA